MRFNWDKKGIVWQALNNSPLTVSHATAPTPFLLNQDVIRVFYTSLDSDGRGRIFWVDLKAEDPRVVLAHSNLPVLDIGQRGMFDDNGVMGLSVVRNKSGDLFLYYAGFELCEKIRYRIFTGLAVSKDNGLSFNRYSRSPILDRTDSETYFRCGTFVKYNEDKYEMWYVAGDSWVITNEKEYPNYNIRYLTSSDGIHWPEQGQLILDTDDISHGFGRPWVISTDNENEYMFFSARSHATSRYSIDVAVKSTEGHWIRQKSVSGIELGTESFAKDAAMYASLIRVGPNLYCFYNGDNFGEAGFALGVAKID